MSKQWENDMAKEMYRNTPDYIRVYTCGYSGNNAMPQPDILVTGVDINHAAELKGPIQSDTVYIEEDDFEQLEGVRNGNTVVYLVIKFSHREPLVIRHFEKLSGYQAVEGAEKYNEMSMAEQFAVLAPPCFDARVTDSGTLALDKPDTDDWPSAQAGADDHEAIISGMGISNEKSTEVSFT
jgi:Holliday junction resolvase